MFPPWEAIISHRGSAVSQSQNVFDAVLATGAARGAPPGVVARDSGFFVRQNKADMLQFVADQVLLIDYHVSFNAYRYCGLEVLLRRDEGTDGILGELLMRFDETRFSRKRVYLEGEDLSRWRSSLHELVHFRQEPLNAKVDPSVFIAQAVQLEIRKQLLNTRNVVRNGYRRIPQDWSISREIVYLSQGKRPSFVSLVESYFPELKSTDASQ